VLGVAAAGLAGAVTRILGRSGTVALAAAGDPLPSPVSVLGAEGVLFAAALGLAGSGASALQGESTAGAEATGSEGLVPSGVTAWPAEAELVVFSCTAETLVRCTN
jgi:hypothetical protein